MGLATIKINDLVLKKAVCYVIVLETEVLSLRKGYTTELALFRLCMEDQDNKIKFTPRLHTERRREGGTVTGWIYSTFPALYFYMSKEAPNSETVYPSG